MSERGTVSGGGIRVLPFGERALLAEVGGVAEVLALRAALADAMLDGIDDLVPAARTVLATFDPHRVSGAAVRAWLEGAGAAAGSTGAAAESAEASPIVLDIAYDGPDLGETAELLGIGPGELAERHERAAWTVAFTGFAPGFGYLTSPDWPFEVPRLDAPRTRVPAGSVGLAGEFSGAYPRETPGGWHLIGTTTASLFDAAGDTDAEAGPARPALLVPGDRVRFRRVAESARSAAPDRRGVPRAAESPVAPPSIEVIEPGLLATVQDLGRPGHASIGVARSGALDRRALGLANRLVGNPETHAGIEVTLGGFRAVAAADAWVAVTGGFGALTIDGAPVDSYAAHEWPLDSELRIGWLDHGARAYVAVRGGIGSGDLGDRTTPVLGSRATDTLARLGPDPLQVGDRLAVGPPPRAAVPPLDLAPWGPPPDHLELDLAPGPREDWFEASAPRLLFDAVWTVSSDTDRVGVRLEGPELVRTDRAELPSEGMVPGALQVPPAGRPVVLLADGPVTGGYPVIAVVTDASLDALAQARPGTRIRFRHARP